ETTGSDPGTRRFRYQPDPRHFARVYVARNPTTQRCRAISLLTFPTASDPSRATWAMISSLVVDGTTMRHPACRSAKRRAAPRFDPSSRSLNHTLVSSTTIIPPDYRYRG